MGVTSVAVFRSSLLIAAAARALEAGLDQSAADRTSIPFFPHKRPVVTAEAIRQPERVAALASFEVTQTKPGTAEVDQERRFA